ncbi:MAG: hypothetical protein ACYC9J_06725 [Sulfuricaulis sp.]
MNKRLLAFILFVAVTGAWAEQTSDPLQAAAEQGNADAQYEMGTLYEFGLDRPKDSVTALAWYMRAGAQGNVLAAKRSADLESRLTPVEVEAARELADRLAAPKQPAPVAETPPDTPVR